MTIAQAIIVGGFALFAGWRLGRLHREVDELKQRVARMEGKDHS
jgi:hypothetical protein